MAYDSTLEALFVIEVLPAYVGNRLDRLVRTPKRHLVEPALMSPLLGVDERGALRDVDILGRLLDSFVVAQLRPENPLADGRPQMFHLRQANGRREVDLVFEFANGSIIALEIKASANPDANDARHLAWLRDSVGGRFIAGAVLHCGRHQTHFGDRIAALPIATWWG